MRKNILFALALILSLPSFAQKDPFKGKGVSLVYGKQTLENKDFGTKNESDLNVGLRYDFARIKLHKDPIADMVRINWDFGFDINFAKYNQIVDDSYQKGNCLAAGMASDSKTGDWNLMQGDIGIAVGPSVHIAPISSYKDVQLTAYYHFIPSGSCLILDSEVNAAFNPFMSFGVAATWKFIGIGYEHRWGGAKYKDFNESNKAVEGVTDDKIQYNTTANNIYLRFAF